MGRMAAALLAILLLCLTCALAEEVVGPAATAVSGTSLYETPKRNAAELMRYYRGVRVEVVREVDAEYVQVNVGEPGVSLMGYMRKADLAFGEAAIRKVRTDKVYCRKEEPRLCTLYSYPDKRSEVVRENVGIECVLGVRDGEWLYVRTWGRERRGFVSVDDLPDFYLDVDDSSFYIDAEPMEGEFTREEAVEIARGEFFGCEDNSVYLGVVRYEGDRVDAQRLAQSTPEVEIWCTIGDELMYIVDFWEENETVYAGLWFIAEGRKIKEIGHNLG